MGQEFPKLLLSYLSCWSLDINDQFNFFKILTSFAWDMLLSRREGFTYREMGSHFKSLILEHKFMSISYKITVMWMPQNTFDGESTLVKVMDWCHQATNHYLSWCWPRDMLPYGFIRPHWVKSICAWWYLLKLKHFRFLRFSWTHQMLFLDENVRILIKISLKFVPKGPVNNIPALVQIMAWHQPGDKPLSAPMMVRFLTHIDH